jgi:ribonuclease P protein component
VRFVRAGVAAPEVSYAIGKWVGSAVDRNRVRRRLRAAIAANEDVLVSGGHYLMSADAAAATIPFDRLAAAVRMLVTHAAGGEA